MDGWRWIIWSQTSRIKGRGRRCREKLNIKKAVKQRHLVALTTIV
jgi:hypothetical protein